MRLNPEDDEDIIMSQEEEEKVDLKERGG